MQEHNEPLSLERAVPDLSDLKPDDLLTEVEGAKLLKVTRQTLANWRSTGRGPRYLKIGRMVRYHRADLAAFIEPVKPARAA